MRKQPGTWQPSSLRAAAALLASLTLFGAPGMTAASQAEAQIEVRAHLVAVRKPVVAAELAGRVLTMAYRAGEAFAQGSVLVSFDCALHRAREARAQAQRDRAGRQMASFQILDRSGATSRLEVGLALADVAAAEAELRLAQLTTQRCEIRAPFAGTVVEQRVQAGEYVTEGQPVIEIVNHAELELEAIVPSQILAWLAPRAVFQVELDEAAEPLLAHVVRIAPIIDPVSQTVKIYAHVVQGTVALVTGMSGRARFRQSAGVR